MAFEIENGILKKYTEEPGETEIIVPEGVTAIGEGVFGDCSDLTHITLPESLESIGDYAFGFCSSLASLTFPKGLKYIGACAFERCDSLTYITLPEGVTAIDECTFKNCCSLRCITLPEGLRSIGRDAFSECYSLIQVILPEGLQSIGKSAFYYCKNLPQVIFPKSLQSIGERAFAHCSNLFKITLPASLKNIGVMAFIECWGLAQIVVSEHNPNYCSVDGVLYTKDRKKLLCWPPFKDGRVILPENLQSIDAYALKGCSDLTQITVPEGVTAIGEGAFCYCENLKQITVSENNQHYCSIDGALYTKDGETLVYCPEGKSSITLPESVKKIGHGALYDHNICVIKLHPDDPEIHWNYEIMNLGVFLDKALKSFRAGTFAVYPKIRTPLVILHYLHTHDAKAEDYIRKNIAKFMAEAVSHDSEEIIRILTRTDRFTNSENIDTIRENIDTFIQQALDENQQRIWAYLADYKNRHFGFAPQDDSLL